MQNFSPSDLKTILHSKRANLYYLEHCRVLVNGGRVEYVTDEGKNSLYWNIPIANTTSLLLGTGTSITQAAMRELAKAGVMVGFCGGGGTPLYSANEMDVEVAWFAPQSEYRPTEYLQHWVRFWFDDGLRLEAAKAFQRARLDADRRALVRQSAARRQRFSGSARTCCCPSLEGSRVLLNAAADGTALLTEEARLTKHCSSSPSTRWITATSSGPKMAAVLTRPIASWTTVTIWLMGWAPRRPGCWACRTVSPSCMARPAGVAWCSTRRT